MQAKNRNAWNVGLWINNDQSLYLTAKDCIRHTRTRNEAAKMMLRTLVECGTTSTPDGVRYSVTTIRQAMVGL